MPLTRDFFSAERRNLFRVFFKAQLKASDCHSFLGVVWSFLAPTATFVLMYFIFHKRFGYAVKAYPLYLLSGILMVNFLTAGVSHLLRTLVAYRHLVLNAGMPREILLAVVFSVHAYKFSIQCILCWLLSLMLGFFNPLHFFLFLFFFPAFLGFVFGLGAALSILYCWVRDLEHLWEMISKSLFFATPIFYSLKNLEGPISFFLFWFNPLTPFVITWHGILAGDLDLSVYFYCLFLGVFFGLGGIFFFISQENYVLERI